LEATIRQPVGACGQLALADVPFGHGVSTTVTPAGGGWLAGSKN
jgi:hypothetical protein